MPNFKQLIDEIVALPTSYDVIRNKYLATLHDYTGRNVIAYYSSWLQRSDLIAQGWSGFSIDDSDKNPFMATIHEMDRDKGLDLLLHTPGGDAAATESLVDYLRSMFGTDIRAIVPQLAMSAGTMVACACKEIVMGKHSSLGPIDPQFSGIAAHAILDEFNRAKEDVEQNPSSAAIWQPIIAKYHPTLIGECENAIRWSEDMVKEWLNSGMFSEFSDSAERVVSFLGSHSETAAQNRHISIETARNIGLTVTPLESDQELQDLVLSVHHVFAHFVSQTTTLKVVANHKGVALYSNFAVD
jgi:ClpP class serine protease